ncbi:Enolase-phosphatase E1 [Dermatophagoides pteronyssinus]|uniref:Enolase-phosphatase E1 n=1 Tax=Dermatophagoides pteronyssinus TaxID=6956 RepID=A0ABQ8IS98_DERPT|nr:Enolase-phosphatase E1 [Dermatophagoides pteronyssinus]
MYECVHLIYNSKKNWQMNLSDEEDSTKSLPTEEATQPQQSATGFDGVVRQERQRRKQNFGPNAKQVRKPNNILVDIYGVIAPWTFVTHLKKFAKDNIGDYVRQNWENKLTRTIVGRMWEQLKIDRKAGMNVPNIEEPNADNKPDEIINTTINGLQWVLESKYPALRTQMEKLCTDLWSNSFETGKLKADIYPDVIDAFHYWRFEEFIKIYSYASGPVEGQRQFLRTTAAGDLNRYIANGLNSSGGYKFDPNKFRGLLAALREPKPDNLLYITDDPRKARAAERVGIRTVIVNRSGSDTGKYDPKETNGMTVVTTLADIEFINDPNAYVIPQCC